MTSFQQAAVTGTTATSLMALQQPTSLTLTSDPPEDLTILRIKGDIGVTISAVADWVMALVVQDTTWTPSSIFSDDADKRILWSQTYNAQSGGSSWSSAGVAVGATLTVSADRATWHIDITPKVRLEAGKALYLVSYEINGTASFTVTTANMRLLFQRSGRR